MHRQALSQVLRDYRTQVLPLYQGLTAFPFTSELDTLARMEALLQSQSQCFSESHYLPGHFTASALVVNADSSRVVLCLHAKLQKWLQLGGHADGHPLLHEVALREASEEAGLTQLQILHPSPEPSSHPLPFDLDIHLIPARPERPAHLHFDLRYLVLTREEALTCSAESLDLAWFSLAEAKKRSSELSMQRQFAKLEWLRPA